YAEQTQRRDQLKSESKEVLQKLIAEMKSGTIQNPKIEELLVHLSERLKHTTGKKVYGYLQPNLKVIVDEIVDELSKEDVVAKAYELWYEMREEVLHSYMDELPDRLPLSQQKEFKSIKNMIIAEADKITKEIVQLEDLGNAESESFLDGLVESDDFDIILNPSTFDYDLTVNEMDDDIDDEYQNVFVKWTDEYKLACNYLFGTDDILQDFNEARKKLTAEAEKGNVLAIYDLGKIFTNGLGIERNPDRANDYYVKAFAGFQEVESRKAWKYTEYRIGKMFVAGLGTEQDYQTAAQWFGLSAEKKYKYAQYSLGALYHRGQGVEQNFQTAFALYLKSAKQGFPYADFEVAKMYRDGVGTDGDEMKSNQHFQKAFYGFELLEKTGHDDKIQYRLGWMLQNGIGTEKDIASAKEYFEKSAQMGNTFSGYSLAKLILKDESSIEEEVHKAIRYLKSVAESDNNDFNPIKSMASYALGKIYLGSKCVVKDIDQAVKFFSKSAEENNQWASYQLGNLFLQGNDITKDIDKAVVYLTNSADQGNQFAQCILGKMYLLGNDVPRDKVLAIKWLTKSAEQGNEYAKFLIDNMEKFNQPSVALSISKMMHHMSRIFEENVSFRKTKEGMKIDSKLLCKLRAKKVAQGYKKDDMGQGMLI
ncbi:MAG: relaxase MobL, partial [Mobilitalea sp.]